ncbi:hypothetical protein QR680_015574 [Steinernema hermaphroditum]|uniref:G-protein coupled receptors family 1 profile domain-containing protein n=1 Tax=Steinernema hermaphroditum TaxID=289476 RepID=A0AA39LKV2_9BILA|nr:hypothetical protein QR680_015574 [Steinernema hermaphroditum]
MTDAFRWRKFPYNSDQLNYLPTRSATNMSSELIYGAIATGVALINIPVIAIIITSPALKNCKELLLVGGICAVDTFLALANAVCIVDRLLSFPADSGDKIIQMDCFFRYYVVAFFYANLLVGIMTLLVSIERFIAVFFPLQYLVSYTRNKGVLMMLGAVIFCTVVLLAAYVYQTYAQNTLISILCYTAFVYPPLFANMLVGIRVGSLGIGILLYIPITIRICQLKITSPKHVVFVSTSTTSIHRQTVHLNAQQRRTINFSVTIGLTCLSDLCLLFIPDLIINFNFFELQAYHMLFYHASLFKTVVNLFIYTFRHNELRKQVLAKLLKCC